MSLLKPSRLITPTDLPATTIKRWRAIDKETIVLAVELGWLTLADLQPRYSMSIEEYLELRETYKLAGVVGLQNGVNTRRSKVRQIDAWGRSHLQSSR